MTSDELNEKIFSSLAAGLINTGCLDGRSVEESKKLIQACAADIVRVLGDTLSGLQAARLAYASEFPPSPIGTPDVGNIHANIRNLKQQLKEKSEALAKTDAALKVLDKNLCQMSIPYMWVAALLKEAKAAYDSAVPS